MKFVFELYAIYALLRFSKAKSIKLWLWNLATAPAWSDLIHVTLRRNDGFLHSFFNFSRSDTFGQIFIRTKFILHKIFFRMEYTFEQENLADVLHLCWKNCEKPFVGGRNHFEGKGVSGGKNQYFCKNEVLNIFYTTIFSKKQSCPNYRKKIFEGMIILQGMGCRMTKINITFFYEKRIIQYGFEIFS